MRGLSIFLGVLTLPACLANPIDLGERQTSRVLIEPSLFPILQRYTRFSVASLATFVFGLGKCPSPPFNSALVGKVENKITDTQVAIFQDDAAKEFIVSFAGSSSLQDFVTDFAFFPVSYSYQGVTCTGCKVHVGFYTAWQSVANGTLDALKSLRAQKPSYATIVTGHSLGGALAAIAYPSMKATNVPVKAVYTFGEPRVGNQAFADFVDKLSGSTQSKIGEYYRVTHHTDGVPNLPSASMGFKHSRTEFYELDDSTGNQTAATTYRCFGQESNDCNLGSAQGFINGDHLVYTGIQMTNGAQCGL